MQQLILNTWQLKQRDDDVALNDDFASSEGWIAAQVPGTVHEALLAAGAIPDPFVGTNEDKVQWVGEADWLYRCVFDLPEGFAGRQVALCLDGLDTFATVWLNGQQLLSSDNMWLGHRVEVARLLRPSGNLLSILFESAWRRGREIEAQHERMDVWNTDPSRVYVRKAQYHYSWDWGPKLIAAGPWLPARTGSARGAHHRPALRYRRRRRSPECRPDTDARRRALAAGHSARRAVRPRRHAGGANVAGGQRQRAKSNDWTCAGLSCGGPTDTESSRSTALR